MILMERDGITVQALSPREEADYKRLGFKTVEIAEKKAKEPKDTKKDGE